MIVFFPSLIQHPRGQMHTFIGDTIKNEFLVDPNTIDPVLNSLGIQRAAYERAQSEEELKVLMFNDINKLKSYLSGPGATDQRFKESVRDRVNLKFTTSVINGIGKQQWQSFTLKSDDPVEYEAMKANISNFKTGALLSTYQFDDENMALIIETSNTVMTLDKQNNDGSVRVANMKGKDGKPMNYSEANLYGAVESNSNWIASDIFTWMVDSGFSPEQMFTERKHEMGGRVARTDRPSTFREGKRHAIDLLQDQEDVRSRAEAALMTLGLLDGQDEIPSVVNEKETISTELPTVLSQPTEEKAEDYSNEINFEQIISEGMKKVAEDKIKSEAGHITMAQDLFPEYVEKFEKFLPHSANIETVKQKVWDEFAKLRNNPGAKIIEKHLYDFMQQRMYLMSKLTTGIQKENSSLKNTNGSLRLELDKMSGEKTRFQSEAANANHEVSVLREENERLQAEVEENEISIAGYAKDFEDVAVMIDELKAERDQLLVFKDENVKLRSDVETKDSLLSTLNNAYENITKSHSMVTETLNRMEKESEDLNHKNSKLTQEREDLLAQVLKLNETATTQMAVTNIATDRVKILEAQLVGMDELLAGTSLELRKANDTIKTHDTAKPLENKTAPVKEEVKAKPAAVNKPVVDEVEKAVNPIDNMSVQEANTVLSEQIQEVRSSLPNIKVRSPLNRDSLKAATQRLGRINESLPKTEQKK